MILHKINNGFIELEFEEMYLLGTAGRWQDYPHIIPEGKVKLALRAVYFEWEDHRILVDPGPGTFIEEYFPDYRFSHLKDIRKELNKAGIKSSEITDILLTHLHFDHCGAVFTKEHERLVPAFPGATLHYSRLQSIAAASPDEFENESYLPDWENLVAPLNVILYDEGERPGFLSDVFYSNGHTEGMMIPFFMAEEGEYCFLSDLFPTALNEEPEVVSRFDRDTALLAREKMLFLEKTRDRNCGSLYFHDALLDL